jgi:arylformamidase
LRIIDLTMPIEAEHPRWPTTLEFKGDIAAGDLARVTTLTVSCHAYTHVDARRHMFVDGATIEATPLTDLVGECAVVDLLDANPLEVIGPERLNRAGAHVREGDLVLLQTGWDRHRSPTTKEFWLDSPYLTREAAEWLYERRVKTVAFDFPQDYPIRLLLKGERRPMAEMVTHDILLRHGVHLVEYVCNTASISRPRVLLSAAPLKVPGADGAPARVYCIEDR